MATRNPFLELSDQLGYVQCSFCTTILLVSVPCSSLLKMVTVKCGHCTCLLSVSLARPSFAPLQLFAPLGDEEENRNALTKTCVDEEDSEEEEEEGKGRKSPPVNLVVNKPPEKRQRAPSAYNRFIKEEIQRIKAKEPNITHKEAFSTAAKNWAHCPRFQQGSIRAKGESCNLLEDGKKPRDGDTNEVIIKTDPNEVFLGRMGQTDWAEFWIPPSDPRRPSDSKITGTGRSKVFHERKASRQSTCVSTPDAP